MADLSTLEGIEAELARIRYGSGPSQYAPLLLRCKQAHLDGAADEKLIDQVEDYASILVAHGAMNLADNLRQAIRHVPRAEATSLPQP